MKNLPEKDALDGMRFRPGTVYELLQVALTANDLTRRLFMRADEMRQTFGTADEDVPDVVREMLNAMVGMAMLKRFPEPLIGRDVPKESRFDRPA